VIAATVNRVANVARNGFRNDAPPLMIFGVGFAPNLPGKSYALFPDAVNNRTLTVSLASLSRQYKPESPSKGSPARPPTGTRRDRLQNQSLMPAASAIIIACPRRKSGRF
jgi:hypothetical protein